MSNQLKTRNGIPFDFVDGLRIKGVDVTNWEKIFIDQGASYVGFQPVGDLVASNVQAALAELDSEKVAKSDLSTGAGAGTVGFTPVTGVSSTNVQSAIAELNTEKVDKTALSNDTGSGLVGFDGGTIDAVLSKNKPITRYSQLRLYAGTATQVHITDPGVEGFFYYDATDTTSVDNGGTIIVGSDNRRWKRHYNGTVSVRWFGAMGDGSTDDTDAIQAALNFGKDVIFSDPSYRITSPLQIGSQRLKGGGGGKWTNRTQSRIIIAGNHAAFVNKDTFPSFEIDGFFVDYGNVTPSDSATSSEKIAFKFITNNGSWPEYIHIKNCTVRGAWYGYYDSTGTYLSKLTQVACRNTVIGFYKFTGTTIEFNSCSASTGTQGFYIDSVLSASLINCAADLLTVDNSTVGLSGNVFRYVPALIIAGWDGEYNNITNTATSVTPELIPSYIRFHNTSATVSGIATLQNRLNSSNVNSGVAFFMVGDFSTVHFSGFDINKQSNDLTFTGSLCPVHTVYASNVSKTTIIGCDIKAPTGGTPTTRYSVFGTLDAYISLINSIYDNSTANINIAINQNAVAVKKIAISDVTYGATFGTSTGLGAGQAYGGFGDELATFQKNGSGTLFSTTAGENTGTTSQFARGNNGAIQNFFRNGIAVGRVDVVNSSTRYFFTSSAFITAGPGNPEGSLPAPPGSFFLRTDGGAGNTMYVKETGTGTSGWVAK